MSLSCLSISPICTKIASVPARLQSCKIGYSFNEYINFPVKTMGRVLIVPMAQKIVGYAVQIGGDRYENHCRKKAANLVEAAWPNLPVNFRQMAIDKVIKPLIQNINQAAAEKAIQLNTNNAVGYAVWSAIASCPWLSAATKISNLSNLSLLPARAIVLSAAAWIGVPIIQKCIEIARNDEEDLIAKYKAAILAKNPALLGTVGGLQNGDQGKKTLNYLIQATLEKQIVKIALLGPEEAAIQKIADLNS